MIEKDQFPCFRLSSYIPIDWSCHSLLMYLRTDFQDSSESGSTSGNDDSSSVIGFASAVIWLIGMTVVIAVLSNYVVTTIEVQNFSKHISRHLIFSTTFLWSMFVWQVCFQEASESLGIPLRFISIILLPIVGNAAEHAGAIIFAFKNKIVSGYPVLSLTAMVI